MPILVTLSGLDQACPVELLAAAAVLWHMWKLVLSQGVSSGEGCKAELLLRSCCLPYQLLTILGAQPALWEEMSPVATDRVDPQSLSVQAV